jgi:beta-glucosidase-like glycosyl hydrolase
MVGNWFFVVIIATCFSFTFSAIINPNAHKTSKVQSRTWDQAVALAKAFVAQMTLEEKCNMTAGVPGPCAGLVSPVPRLNFSGLCFQDSPSGVGDGVLYTTAFAAGIHIAATWDRDLFYKRGAAIGKEFRGKGVHFALGPMMNIDRNALHGRNWEGFGSDPYLSGENAFYYVQGLQDQGVVATAKHYICNEQETNRFYGTPESIPGLGDVNSMGYSANLDDKTIHEIYLWPFIDSVAAGAGSIMCSYNQVNGTQACQNDKTLNGLLKGELAFQGNVMSDWGATKTGIESVLGGLDIEMPGGDGFLGYSLLKAVQSGTLTEAKINDMITRVLAPYFLLGQDQGYPTLDFDRDTTGDNYMINRQVAAAGMVLLKNTNNILPFNVPNDKFFSVYGSAAGPFNDGFGPWGSDEGFNGALFQGGGSGYVQPTYGIDPLHSLITKARDSHLQIQYVINQNDYNAINNSFNARGFGNGKCLVFVNAWSSEGRDRYNLHAFNDGDKLVQTVASRCANTIVVVNSVSQLNLDAWIDLPNIVGVIWSGLPGPEYGPTIVDVLFGDYNPGGKLAFSLARNDSDFGTNITESYNSNYTEGVFLDYRHFDKFNIAPRYYFGYGLSYTTFSFANLDIIKAGKGKHTSSSQHRQHEMRSYAGVGAAKLYAPVYEATFTITNTGKVDGSEVPQLYVGFPAEAEEPPKILRGFERIYLSPGESKQVTLTLAQKDISYWNVVNQKWTVAPGTYTVWISTSADKNDIKLQSSFNV